MPAHWSDTNLRQTLERLAASGDEQREYLQQIGSFPSLDELALEFDDEFQCVRAVASVALGKVDEQLSIMSGADLWKPEALDGNEWARVRVLAGAALMELDK